jgi:hypothetical protein
MTRLLAVLLILALTGCTGCIYGRDYTVFGTDQHVCLDP